MANLRATTDIQLSNGVRRPLRLGPSRPHVRIAGQHAATIVNQQRSLTSAVCLRCEWKSWLEAQVTHGLVVHEPHHIMPILRVRYLTSGGNPQPLGFMGTGFVIEGGYFLTCWHCVSAPLGNDEAYVAVAKPTDLATTPAGLLRLHDLAQDENGTDLALARVNSHIEPGLVLARLQAQQGEDVATWGYPLIPPAQRRAEDNQLTFELNARFLKGYVTQTFMYDKPGARPVPSIELDMPAPAGLSGAPLVRAGTAEVLGVIYGSNDVATIDGYVTVDTDTGERRIEMQKVTQFGLAHWTETLWAARGPATEGHTLATVHERHVGPGR